MINVYGAELKSHKTKLLGILYIKIDGRVNFLLIYEKERN